MSEFSGMYLTRKGKNLLAKGQIGTTISFSKVVLGDGSLPDGQDIEDLEAVISHKMDVAIHSLTIIGDGTSQVRFILANQGLLTGFFVREIGLMANDPGEGDILYAYANAGSTADFIPSGGGATVVENQIDLIAVVGNAANVTASVGVVHLALKEDIEDHDVDPKAHDGRLFAIEETLALNGLFTPLRSLLELFVTNFTLYDNDSTTWSVSTGHAVAGNAGEYIALSLRLPEGNCDKAVVVRRTDNDGVLALSFRDGAHPSWTPAPWSWKRSAGSGWLDVEYLVPARNAMDIRIVSTRGASAVDPVIDFIAFVEAATGLGGTHNPPVTPSIVYPADGATGIGERPSITTSAYSHPALAAQAGSEFQIASDSGFENLIAGSGVVQGISYAPADNVLSVSTTYYARARHIDINGGISGWSGGVSFTTDSTFVTVNKPAAAAPVSGAELSSPDSLILVSSAFSTDGGTDTHASSQWQISTEPAFENLFYDSGETIVDKTSHAVADGTVERGNTYYWRVRHKGTAEGWSDWSNATVFSVSDVTTFVSLFTAEGNSQFWAVESDASQNVYAAGVDGNSCALVLKCHAAGILSWQKKLDGSGQERFHDIAMDSAGNVYLVGYDSSLAGVAHGLIAKYNPDGALIWQKLLSSNNSDYFWGIAIDSENNIFVAGQSNYESGSAGSTAIIARYNADGNLIWQKALVQADGSVFKRIATGSTPGSVFVCGFSSPAGYRGLVARYDLNGNLIWQREFSTWNSELSDIHLDSAGNVYVAGQSNFGGAGYAAFIAKIDGDGNRVWMKNLYPSGSMFQRVRVDDAGNILACGKTASQDALIAKYSADGTLIWQKTLKGTSTECFYGLAVAGPAIFIAGYEQSYNGASNCLLVSMSSDAGGAAGNIPGIPALAWDNPGLTDSTPTSGYGSSGLSVQACSLSASVLSSASSSTNLAQVFSEY